MESMAWAFPMQPGQFDRLMGHQEDVVRGEMADENLAHWNDTGLSAVKLYHQREPVEAIIVYLEGEDVKKAIDPREHGGKPVHEQWMEFFQTMYGKPIPGTPPAVVIDWHRQTGHVAGTPSSGA